MAGSPIGEFCTRKIRKPGPFDDLEWHLLLRFGVQIRIILEEKALINSPAWKKVNKNRLFWPIFNVKNGVFQAKIAAFTRFYPERQPYTDT